MLNFIASINELFWGAILILLLVGTGIFYTLKLRPLKLKKNYTNKNILKYKLHNSSVLLPESLG